MSQLTQDRRLVVGFTSVVTIIAVIAAFLVLAEYGSRLSPPQQHHRRTKPPRQAPASWGMHPS